MDKGKHGISPKLIEHELEDERTLAHSLHRKEIVSFKAHVRRDYSVVVNTDRKYTEVSDSFCKLLGYRREELLGKRYDEFTAPGTNDIPVVLELFVKSGYMHGIWVFVHRSGTKILVRYEAWIRRDGQYQGHMELLGAGA
jgi:PAS domain S-box-containing protein